MTADEPIERQLASLCARLFGMRPPDDARLLAYAEGRARALSQALPDYVTRLHADPLEQAALSAVATNGWTWFWREAAALEEACARLAARAPRRRLHAWVAGCSTGEEAFTLAILAARAGLDLWILGTDIDAARVEHARRGIYATPALRHLPADVADRYFTPEGDGWRPRMDLRERVRFEVHNLLDAPVEPPSGEWDLISCRNVMLHAGAPAARRILAHLSAVRDPFGERVFSAVDELTVEEARLARSTPPPPPSSSPRPPTPARDAEATLRERTRTRPGDFVAHVTLGNILLAGHRLDEAASAYEAAEALDPGSAELLIMQGILHRKAGRIRAAEEVLRRALFLEPDLWLGWLLLAGVYERLGVPDRARRALQASLQGLRRRPRLEWRAPDGGVTDRRWDAEAAERLCRARLSAGAPAPGRSHE